MASARTAQRLTRILAMLPWVISHPGATVDEVCERFGYTRSELLADLDLVFVCGLPGYGPGDLMVAYVEDDRVVVDTADYFAAAPRLSASEALALLASGMTVMASGQGSPELASAVEKLTRALLPDGEEALAVDVAPEHQLASTLRTAAAEGQVVEITYRSLSREEDDPARIEPWAVLTAMGNWYVSAHCRRAGGQRVFRLDRIREAERTGERFDPPADPPPPEVGYTPAEDDVRAVLSLGPGARWVAEYYPVDVLDDDGGRLRVGFSASDPQLVARLLLRLGPHAELVEGAEVERELESLRTAVLARYGVERPIPG